MMERIDIYLRESHEFVENVILLLNGDEEIQSHHIEFLHLPTDEERQEIFRNIKMDIRTFIQTLHNRINTYILVQFNHEESLHQEIQTLDPLYTSSLMSGNLSIRIRKLCEINNVHEYIAVQVLRELTLDFIQYQKQSQCVSFLNNNIAEIENCDEECDDGEITVLIENNSDFGDTTAGVHFESVKFVTMIYTGYCSLCMLKHIGASNGRKKRFANIFRLYMYIALIPATQVKCEILILLIESSKNRPKYHCI